MTSRTSFLAVIAAVFLAGAAPAHAGERILSYYERQILASVLVLEAASDGLEGMSAVLNVIANRADRNVHRLVPEAVRPGQFSAINRVTKMRSPDYSSIMRRAQRDPLYAEAVRLVLQFERGQLADNTQGSTYYHHHRIQPGWSRALVYTGTIGSHRFYAEPHLAEAGAELPSDRS